MRNKWSGRNKGLVATGLRKIQFPATPLADPKTDYTFDIYGALWRAHILPNRRGLNFREAKTLCHQIFDDFGMPRPFFKCMPSHYNDLGYCTNEYEIFVHEKTWDDTVIHEAAHLFLGGNEKMAADPLKGHHRYWFANYMAMLATYSSVPKKSIIAMMIGVAKKFGVLIEAEFLRSPVEALSSWAHLKPGSETYEMAVRAGCYMYQNEEPLPLRDPHLRSNMRSKMQE